MIEMNSNEKEAWSYWLSCSLDDFDGFKLHRNPRLDESNQIILLVSKYGFNISVPSSRYNQILQQLDCLADFPIKTVSDIINLLKHEIKKVGYILYQACPNDDFDYTKDLGSFVHLGTEKKSKLHELKKACSKTEWDHSCLTLYSDNAFGVFKHDNLVSASHYLIFPGRLASLGMITHPKHRAQGFAKIATIGAAKHALSCGLMIHYQTLIENTNAIALSKSLGFEQFGYSCRLELS